MINLKRNFFPQHRKVHMLGKNYSLDVNFVFHNENIYFNNQFYTNRNKHVSVFKDCVEYCYFYG